MREEALKWNIATEAEKENIMYASYLF